MLKFLASKDVGESFNITTTHLLRPFCVGKSPVIRNLKPKSEIFVRTNEHSLDGTRLEEEDRIKSFRNPFTESQRKSGFTTQLNLNSSQIISFLLTVSFINLIVNSPTCTSSNCLEVCTYNMIKVQNIDTIKLYYKIA